MAPDDSTLPGSSPGTSFLARMAERLGANARAEAVYYPPVVQGDVTVVPVASVRWGFGGGNGTTAGPEGTDGSGGGGGVIVKPIGYLEVKEGGSTFKPIRDPAALASVILAGGVAAALVLRGLRRILAAT